MTSEDFSERDDVGQEDSRTGGEPRRVTKSDAAFRTISEVADELNVPQHVLRFWETKFTQIRPLKRGGGRRYYRPEDVTVLKRIRTLLYTDGLTIKGVQRLLRESGNRAAGEETRPQAVTSAAPPDIAWRDEAIHVLAELKGLRDQLTRALGAS